MIQFPGISVLRSSKDTHMSAEYFASRNVEPRLPSIYTTFVATRSMIPSDRYKQKEEEKRVQIGRLPYRRKTNKKL